MMLRNWQKNYTKIYIKLHIFGQTDNQYRSIWPSKMQIWYEVNVLTDWPEKEKAREQTLTLADWIDILMFFFVPKVAIYWTTDIG